MIDDAGRCVYSCLVPDETSLVGVGARLIRRPTMRFAHVVEVVDVVSRIRVVSQERCGGGRLRGLGEGVYDEVG